MEQSDTQRPVRPSNTFLAKTFVILRYIIVRTVEAGIMNLDVLRREAAFFGGLALFLIGVFSFHAGRYCDGNTADYLSCTRPAVYYYYGVFDITIIVLGAFFIAAWVLRPRRK